MLGFATDHTQSAVPKSEVRRAPQAAADTWAGLLGNSYSCHVMALVLGHMLADAGVLARPPTLREVMGELGDEDTAASVQAFRFLPSSPEEKLVAALHRCAVFRGSDVRVTTGALYHPGRWPREAVNPHLWSWKPIISTAP